MAVARPSYQRLKHDEDDDYDLRLRSSRFRRFHVRRRLRVKIPNFKRLLRRKARLIATAWNKVRTRLKESQSHFGDLFAGNYLFMQVTPTPSFGNSFVKTRAHDLRGLSSRYSVPRVAS